MIQKIRLNIGGMTCVNCQNKIEKALKDTSGILSAKVSYNNASADIEYDSEIISRSEIAAIIEAPDYKIVDKNAVPSLANIISILVIIVSLYVILQELGLLNLLVPSRLADTTMGYGMLFVIGLITSVHCIAMCGGINISQCIPQHIPRENRQKKSAFLPSLAYNAVTVSAGGSLIIPTADITDVASFFPIEVDGTAMEVLAIRASDGTIRTAFNTCQSCYTSGHGYYVQEGSDLVCQNCGFHSG